ncbi:MAG: anti-sigma factor family protein [Bryobacteraceae bacterium]
MRDQLENLLAAGEPATGKTEGGAHLAHCPECSSELRVMKEQSSFLRSLRTGEELEAPAGFYARVLQRIEDRAKASIWAGFLRSPSRTRFAYASLSLALLLGMYVFVEEKADLDPHDQSVIAQQANSVDSVFGDQTQQRDAVLVNFASYEGSLQ